ncbi:MFS transporter [Sphingomonas sp. 1185]|uniref:MFS transporter n=1 Tax=Sphingomonas sp. 1185 TaxID=3156411 RepID=UPI003396E917
MSNPASPSIAEQCGNRLFGRFLTGNAAALLALAMGQVALPWWIVSTGGSRDLALYAFWAAVVGCLATPLLAALGDRHDQYGLIRLGLAINVTSAASLAFLATKSYYAIGPVLAVAIVEVVGVALAFSLINVAATEMLPAAALPRALQQQKLVQSAAQLAGPVVAGAVLAASGVAAVLWVQAGLTALASILMIGGRKQTPSRVHTDTWLTDVYVGIRAKWRIPLERNWTAISFMVAIFLVPCVGLLLPLKIRELGLGGSWFAAAEAAMSAGLLSGAVIGASNRIVEKIGRYRLRLIATMSLGPAFVLTGLSERPALLLVSLGLAGVFNSLVVMMGYSRRIIATPASFRTRMTSTSTVLTQVASIIGPAIAGFAILLSSTSWIYITFGFLITVVNIGYCWTPGLKTFLDASDADVDEWYGKFYPHAFDNAKV